MGEGKSKSAVAKKLVVPAIISATVLAIGILTGGCGPKPGECMERTLPDGTVVLVGDCPDAGPVA